MFLEGRIDSIIIIIITGDFAQNSGLAIFFVPVVYNHKSCPYGKITINY
jgi:hypothetical protein